MWTVVYITQNKEQLELLKDRLEAEGLLVKIKPVQKESHSSSFEVLVPDSEIEQAHGVIMECGF